MPKKPLNFDEEGVVVLGCNIHDSMIGYIFVSPWPVFGVTPADGLAHFNTRPKEIAVWHPWVTGLKEPMIIEVDRSDAQVFEVKLEINAPKPAKKLKNKFKKFYQEK